MPSSNVISFNECAIDQPVVHLSPKWIKTPLSNGVKQIASGLLSNESFKLPELTTDQLDKVVRLQSVWRGYQERRPIFSLFHACRRTDNATIKSEYETKLSSKEAAEKIQFNDPMFYLYAVRPSTKVAEAVAGNEKVRDELIAVDKDLRSPLSELKAPYETLIHQIHTGQWGRADDSFLQKTFPSDHKFYNLSPKRLLFYAHWDGRISDSDFETALHAFALQEDHSVGAKPQYFDIHKAEPIEAIVLPAELKVCFLMKNKVLTQEGSDYLDRLEQGFNDQTPRQNRLRYGKETPFDRERFLAKLKRLPENQQIIFLAQDIESKSIVKDDGIAIWYEQLIIPFSSSPLQDTLETTQARDDIELESADKISYAWPSVGVAYAFRSLLATLPTDRVVGKLVSCLGTVGIPTLVRSHKERYQPVLDTEKDIRTNHLFPHGQRSGSVVGRMHDDYHLLRLTAFGPTLQQFRLLFLPKALMLAKQSLLGLTSVENKMIKDLHDWIVNDSVDMELLDTKIRHAESFLCEKLNESSNADGVEVPECDRYLRGIYFENLLTQLNQLNLPLPYSNGAGKLGIADIQLYFGKENLPVDRVIKAVSQTAFSEGWQTFASTLLWKNLDSVFKAINTPEQLSRGMQFSALFFSRMMAYENQRLSLTDEKHDCTRLLVALQKHFETIACGKNEHPTLVTRFIHTDTLNFILSYDGAGYGKSFCRFEFSDDGSVLKVIGRDYAGPLEIKIDEQGCVSGIAGDEFLLEQLLVSNDLNNDFFDKYFAL